MDGHKRRPRQCPGCKTVYSGRRFLQHKEENYNHDAGLWTCAPSTSAALDTVAEATTTDYAVTNDQEDVARSTPENGTFAL